MIKMAQTIPNKCQLKATNYFRNSLKSSHIYSLYLFPSIINCLVYVVHFSLDLVVAVQHLREDNPLWAGLTSFFMYAPAFAHFILIVSKPDWWMTDNDKQRGTILWSIIQFGEYMAFPFLALYRYAGLIVLSVDAIILSGDERRKTLETAAAPAKIELYFFLQAWFQAAPQAVFQTHLLFRRQQVFPIGQSVIIHVLCILMSICVVAMRTASFQRYESHRIIGLKVPWATWYKEPKTQELTDSEEKQLLASAALPQKEMEMIHESKSVNLYHSSLQKQVSSTPPLPPKNAKIVPPPTPLRGITSIPRMAVPDLPAPPRPDSFETDNSQNAQIKVLSSASSDDEKYNLVAFKKIDTINIPKELSHREILEDTNPVEMISSVIWWFSFILARILSIVIFFEFYPFSSVGILGLHYICMISYLLYCTKYNDVTNLFINLWLGLIYIFSTIEYRIKFKNADKWLAMYCTFVMAQNSLMTLHWYFDDNWDGLWYSISFYAILIGMGLCLLSTILHHLLPKPERRRVYAT